MYEYYVDNTKVNFQLNKVHFIEDAHKSHTFLLYNLYTKNTYQFSANYRYDKYEE